MNGLVVIKIGFLSLISHLLISNAQNFIDQPLTDAHPSTCSMTACPVLQCIEPYLYAYVDTSVPFIHLLYI